MIYRTLKWKSYYNTRFWIVYFPAFHKIIFINPAKYFKVIFCISLKFTTEYIYIIKNMYVQVNTGYIIYNVFITSGVFYINHGSDYNTTSRASNFTKLSDTITILPLYTFLKKLKTDLSHLYCTNMAKDNYHLSWTRVIF